MHFSREQIENANSPAELQAILSAAGPSSSTKWIVGTLPEVADFHRVAVSTVKGWSQEGMPGSNGAWNLSEITRWRLDRLTNNDLATVRKEQEIELNAIAIEQKRLDLERQKGELVLLVDCERWAAQAICEFRELVMALPEMLSTSSPPELRDFIRSESDRHCRDALIAARRRLEIAQLHEESASGDVAADENDDPASRSPA